MKNSSLLKNNSNNEDGNKKGYIFPRVPTHKGPLLHSAFFSAGVIGLHPVGGLLVGGALGYFLWHKFALQALFWVFLAAGFAAGCLNAYRDIQRLLREESEQK